MTSIILKKEVIFIIFYFLVPEWRPNLVILKDNIEITMSIIQSSYNILNKPSNFHFHQDFAAIIQF